MIMWWCFVPISAVNHLWLSAFADTVVAAKNLDAGKIIKEHVAPLIKGGGGGQKNLATAGGQDASNLKQVIEKVKSLLA